MTIKLPNIYNESTTFNDLSELQQDLTRQWFAALDRVRPVVGPANDGSGSFIRLYRDHDVLSGERGWRQRIPGETYTKHEVFFISEEEARHMAATIMEALKET